MITRIKRIVVAAFLPVLTLGLVSAQPVWNSRQVIEGRAVFKDARQKNKYYYGPGELVLSQDKIGKPVFQLLSMRYTGTTRTNDADEKRFTNLLMFGISMPMFTVAEQNAIKSQLPPKSELSPLPIRHLESVLVSGVGKPEEGDSGRMRKHTGSQQESGDAPGVYWTERTFTVPLDNHDAQILWDQVENGHLIMSLNYSFFANMATIQEESLQVSGDSAFVSQMTEAAIGIERDTQIKSELVRADVINIEIDAKRYPELLQKIDINAASIPPAYAAFEVKCFDFCLGIRPDLAFKTVEIEGISLTNVPITTKVKFSSKQPDMTSKFAAFKYAVRMDQPIRYRVQETPFEEEPRQGAWKVMEQFTNLIDASTPQKKNPLQQRNIDVEILPEYMTEKGVASASVHLVYQLGGRQQITTLEFNKNNAPYFSTACLIFEQAQPLRYFITRHYEDGHRTKGILRNVGTDDYILVGK